MDLYKTNWYEKDPDEVLDVIYIDLEDDESRYEFFKHLIQNYPELEIDWLETFEDMKNYLLENERIPDILYFVDWYKTKNPQDYKDRHEFIERDLCNYYLFQKDYVSLKARMDFIKQHPVKSIDTLTTRLLYQLIYHGLYNEAVDFASAVWKPIDESDELLGMPAYDFVNTIYINELQKFYEAFLVETPFDTSAIFKKATEMGFTEDKNLFDQVVYAIESDMDYELINKSIQKNKDEHMLHLNIQFLKYMFTEYKLPFIFSELMWQFIATLKIFGKHGKDRWFFIDAKTMDNYIAERLDLLYTSNTLQRFGQVWGFDYLISFFEHFQLLSEEDAAIMSENNQYFKKHMIQLANESLWQMNFIFNWPEVDMYEELVVTPSLFNSTFGMDYMETTDYIYESMSAIPENQRIERELQVNKKSGMVSESDSDEPYVKTEAKVGRNDPCPCGSGKKYKKCCLTVN